MSQLGELLQQAEQYEKIKKIDPNEPKYHKTRGAMQTKVRQAADQINKLKQSYYDNVFPQSLLIAVNGPEDKVEAFVNLVNSLEEGVGVNAHHMYDRMAKPVEAQLGTRRQLSVNNSARILEELGRIVDDLEVVKIVKLQIKALPILKTYQDVRNFVKDQIDSQAGMMLLFQFMKKQIAEKAFTMKFSGSVLPVVVGNLTATNFEQFRDSFGKGGTSYTIEADDVVNSDYVYNVFSQVKERFKPATKKTKKTTKESGEE